MKSVSRVLTGCVLALCLLMTAGNAMAEGNGPKFKLGVGTYGLAIADDSSRYDGEDDRFSGGALVGTACFTQHVALRGAFYATEHEDYSAMDMNGVDLQILLGTNFFQGWNVFGGLGIFSETLEVSSGVGGYTVTAEKDFSGAELSFGFGYSWPKVALDFVANVRDTSDYEDFTGVDHDYAVSSGITLSYIF